MTTDITFWIAVSSLAISTFLAILQAVQFFKDKSKLIVEVEHAGFVEHDFQGHELIIKATNQGRRPITIESIGISMGGVLYEASDKMEASLEESISVSGTIILSKLNETPMEDRYAKGWAKDHTGKTHYSKKFMRLPKQWFRLTPMPSS
jgi:hypothetical protein